MNESNTTAYFAKILMQAILSDDINLIADTLNEVVKQYNDVKGIKISCFQDESMQVSFTLRELKK